MSSNLSPLNKSCASSISLRSKTPTIDLDCKERSSLKEDEKKTNTSLFQNNPNSTFSSQIKTSPNTQNDNTTHSLIENAKEKNTPSPTVKSLRSASENEKTPLSYEEKKSIFTVSEKNEYIKPTQKWVDEKIKEIFRYTKKGGSIYLKMELDDILKLLTQGYKISEKISKEMIAKMVNAKDKDGKSPLYYAIDHRSPQHVEVLCEFGAKITTQDEISLAKEPFIRLNSILNLLKIPLDR